MPWGLFVGFKALGALLGPVARYLWIGAAVSALITGVILWDKARIAKAERVGAAKVRAEISRQIAEDNLKIEQENTDAFEAAENINPTPDNRADLVRLCTEDKACRSHGR